MPYLELAENVGGVDYYQSLAQNTTTQDLYVFVPTDPSGQTGKWVREDYFDNLPPAQWEQVMEELADYQPDMMNGIFSNIRENIAARRERRGERKDARQDSKMERIEGRSGGLFGGKLKNLVSSFIPDMGGGAGMNVPTGLPPMTRDMSIEFGTEPPSFFDKNKAWLIPVGAAALIGGVYLITKKKK